MINWKPIDPRYGSGDSTLGISFREGEPEIAKQLSDEKGFYVDKKEATVNGYTYKVKMVVSKKDNRQYIFIEREISQEVLGEDRPEVTAAKSVAKEYNGFDQRQKDIAAAHADNQKMHNERMAFDKERLAFDKAATEEQNHVMINFAATVARILDERNERDSKLVELLEATLKMLPLFKTADKLEMKTQ